MFEPEVFRKQMYCFEESIGDIVGTFRRLHSDSEPGELCPLCPPSRYAPDPTGTVRFTGDLSLSFF